MRRANHQASINVNIAVCIWDVFHKVNVKCQATNVETTLKKAQARVTKCIQIELKISKVADVKINACLKFNQQLSIAFEAA